MLPQQQMNLMLEFVSEQLKGRHLRLVPLPSSRMDSKLLITTAPRETSSKGNKQRIQDGTHTVFEVISTVASLFSC